MSSNEIITYNPSSLLNIFNNTLTGDATRKVFRIKGIYIQGKGVNYSGAYYDTLKDETSDACITLIVPALLRDQLVSEQTIECNAYLTKKVQPNAGRIDLQVNVIEVLSQTESAFTEEQIRAFETLQRKAEQGYKDVDAFIKSKIIKQEPITVTLLIGKSAIIDSDIKHQLKEAIGFYELRFVRINLSSEREIISSIHMYDNNTDVLIVARGGGENMEVFNRSSLAEEALSLRCLFVTAIGHKEDTSLLQKVSDKAFITPTALGQYFNEIYNQTVEELQGSKARLVEDITKQLEGNYNKQVSNLNEQLENNKRLSEQKELMTNEQIENLKNELSKRKVLSPVTFLLILIACALGILIGRGCN